MTDKLPDHETIERAFRTEPERVLGQLDPSRKSVEYRRSLHHLDIAYEYAKEAREKIKAEPAEDE